MSASLLIPLTYHRRRSLRRSPRLRRIASCPWRGGNPGASSGQAARWANQTPGHRSDGSSPGSQWHLFVPLHHSLDQRLPRPQACEKVATDCTGRKTSEKDRDSEAATFQDQSASTDCEMRSPQLVSIAPDVMKKLDLRTGRVRAPSTPHPFDGGDY